MRSDDLEGVFGLLQDDSEARYICVTQRSVTFLDLINLDR